MCGVSTDGVGGEYWWSGGGTLMEWGSTAAVERTLVGWGALDAVGLLRSGGNTNAVEGALMEWGSIDGVGGALAQRMRVEVR